MVRIDIEPSEDMAAVAAILLEQWDKFAEDGIKPEDVNIGQSGKEVWLDLYVDDSLAGVCLVTPIQKHTVAIHPYFSYEHRHYMRSVAQELYQWLFRTGSVNKIQAIIGVQWKYLHKLCDRLGMEREGVLKQSYLKDGEFHDQTVFGLTREEFYK